jgi:hypothetical protein
MKNQTNTRIYELLDKEPTPFLSTVQFSELWIWATQTEGNEIYDMIVYKNDARIDVQVQSFVFERGGQRKKQFWLTNKATKAKVTLNEEEFEKFITDSQ